MAAIHQLGLLEKNERLNIKALATRANAPEKFLSQILLELKKVHILQSKKGANGGYSLEKPMYAISLKDIISTLETNAFEEICKTDNPTLKLFWEEKQKALMAVLDTPLSELTNYHKRTNLSFNYMI